MSILDGLIEIAPDDSDDDEGPHWPHSGQKFEVVINVTEDGDELFFELTDPPSEVHNVVSDFGFGVTDDLFTNLPEAVGVWKCQVEFVYETHTDWESGQREDDFGFTVISKEKL